MTRGELRGPGPSDSGSPRSTPERQRMTYLVRYTLHRIDGTKTIFEARSGDVMAEDRGLRVWESRFKSRFYPFHTITEMECVRVAWMEVS